MKNLRLDPDLAAKLERAAHALGISQVELIREALVRRCQEVLGGSLAERLTPVIGIVNSSGGRAAHSGAAFRRGLGRRRQ